MTIGKKVLHNFVERAKICHNNATYPPSDVNYCDEGTFISWEIFAMEHGMDTPGKKIDKVAEENSKKISQNDWNGYQIAEN